MTKPAEVEALAEAVLRDHGRVDILVADAGSARFGTGAEDVIDEHQLAVNDIDDHSVFWCNRTFAKPMLKAAAPPMLWRPSRPSG